MSTKLVKRKTPAQDRDLSFEDKLFIKEQCKKKVKWDIDINNPMEIKKGINRLSTIASHNMTKEHNTQWYEHRRAIGDGGDSPVNMMRRISTFFKKLFGKEKDYYTDFESQLYNLTMTKISYAMEMAPKKKYLSQTVKNQITALLKRAETDYKEWVKEYQ